ncbi:MAG TPA: M20/M25/M40 family metallo-hydrolase [Anaerolineae bacterium]|nr:M20/M25/M40 family metallo-hydrolase [Anaerolineae bacterium]
MTHHTNQSLRRRIPFLLFLLFFVSGCSLLKGPQQLVVPTAIPAAPPLAAESSFELVTDPVSNVTIGVDSEVLNLVNQVSQQQLTGYVQTLENFFTRSTFSVVDREGEGIGAARRWIFNEFIRVGNGRLQVELDEFPVVLNGVTYNQQNIIATLPGAGPHPGVLVITAHYDSRPLNPNDGASHAPGANDNGSGVALLLELARIMSIREWNQTIMFVTTSGEEQARYGSSHFVSEQLLNGRQIDANINVDIVGGRPGIPQSVRVFAPGPSSSQHRHFVRYMELAAGMYVPQFPLTWVNARDRDGRWGDQMSFQDAGITGVRLTESEEDRNNQHNSGDTWEKLDYNYLRQVTQLVVAVAGNIAGAPPPPPIPNVSPAAEPGAYLITWAPDRLAAGYAIAFRPIESDTTPPLRFVNREQAGNVALSGFDPGVTYAVSMASVDGNGRVGLFSPEIMVGP